MFLGINKHKTILYVYNVIQRSTQYSPTSKGCTVRRGIKSNKALCHSERSDSAAEESSRRRIHYFYTLLDSSASSECHIKLSNRFSNTTKPTDKRQQPFNPWASFRLFILFLFNSHYIPKRRSRYNYRSNYRSIRSAAPTIRNK